MDEPLKPSVLVVDDVVENIDILVETLSQDFEISVATSGSSALELVADEQPDIILLDVMMPGMSGHEVCKALKSDEVTKGIPVVFVTALSEEIDEAKGLALGAIDYITKPFSPDLVKARVQIHLALKQYRDHLEEMVSERTRQLELTQEAAIEVLCTLAEYRDPETGGHIRRTQHYVRALALQLQSHPKFHDELDDTTIEMLFRSAPLHDVGKVAIPDGILLKPGRLTPEEWHEMQKHVCVGRDAIASQERKLGANSFLRIAKEIAAGHHEKWDGTGYPDGLKGEEIPVPARMMAIADVYDALISKRVYKPPFEHMKAVQIIREGSGTQFDPDMVDAFLVIEETFRRIAVTYADFQEERDVLAQHVP